MLDINKIKNSIKDFSEKNKLLEEKNKNNMEIDKNNYFNKNYKNYENVITINKYKDKNKMDIVCDKITIEIEYIEIEDENTLDYFNQNKLIEEIINECKKYNLA
jgi:hypothetical protein